jgi:hypothetical protein
MRVDPFAGDLERLTKHDRYSFRRRVGNYRILFNVDTVARRVRVGAVERRTTTTYKRRWGGFRRSVVDWYLYTFFTEGRLINMGALLLSTSVIIFMLGLVSEQVAQLRMERFLAPPPAEHPPEP